MAGEKTYISAYVPIEMAQRFEKAGDDDERYAMIEKLIEGKQHDMREDLALLDEDVLRFRGMLLAYKKAYGEVLEAHSAEMYKVWEDIDSKMPDMRKKAEAVGAGVREVKGELVRVSEEIATLTKKLNGMNTYQLTEMVKLIDAIEHCSDSTKQVLAKVLGEIA